MQIKDREKQNKSDSKYNKVLSSVVIKKTHINSNSPKYSTSRKRKSFVLYLHGSDLENVSLSSRFLGIERTEKSESP